MTRAMAGKRRLAHFVALTGVLSAFVHGSVACSATEEPAEADPGGAGDGGAGGATPRTAGGGRPGGAAGAGGTAGAASVGLEGGTAGEAGAAPVNAFPCNDPQPVGGGFEACNQSADDPGQRYVRRPSAGTCPNAVPRSDAVVEGGAGGSLGYEVNCTHDSDCPGQYEFCSTNILCSDVVPLENYDCWTGCVTDDDCRSDEACLCGDLLRESAPVGVCVKARCRIDSDCAPGFFCVVSEDYHYHPMLACQRPEDECGGTQCDCPGAVCDNTEGDCLIYRPPHDEPDEVPERRMCDLMTSCGGW